MGWRGNENENGGHKIVDFSALLFVDLIVKAINSERLILGSWVTGMKLYVFFLAGYFNPPKIIIKLSHYLPSYHTPSPYAFYYTYVPHSTVKLFFTHTHTNISNNTPNK